VITEMAPVTVITGECPSRPGIHATLVWHCTLPMAFGEGETAGDAAGDLKWKLMSESSGVSGWQLTDLEYVIADVRVFAGRGSPIPGEGRETEAQLPERVKV
jgi:hypothetical protein